MLQPAPRARTPARLASSPLERDAERLEHVRDERVILSERLPRHPRRQPRLRRVERNLRQNPPQRDQTLRVDKLSEPRRVRAQLAHDVQERRPVQHHRAAPAEFGILDGAEPAQLLRRGRARSSERLGERGDHGAGVRTRELLGPGLHDGEGGVVRRVQPHPRPFDLEEGAHVAISRPEVHVAPRRLPGGPPFEVLSAGVAGVGDGGLVNGEGVVLQEEGHDEGPGLFVLGNRGLTRAVHELTGETHHLPLVDEPLVEAHVLLGHLRHQSVHAVERVRIGTDAGDVGGHDPFGNRRRPRGGRHGRKIVIRQAALRRVPSLGVLVAVPERQHEAEHHHVPAHA
mmetsp:Transcript_5096/g.22767  ORF Transcript_5096/g.22767 Transcript_5096/m.22767 type:complete len:342 (+) Transcript_5096:1011-2036(+)